MSEQQTPEKALGGYQSGRTGPSTATESPGVANGPQNGTQALDRLRRLRHQLATEEAKARAADRHPRPDLNHLRVTAHNGIAAGLAIALFYIDHHLRETDEAAGGDLHARLAAAIRDSPARYPDDIATAVLPVVQRETAQLRRERDMALDAARRLRAQINTNSKENR